MKILLLEDNKKLNSTIIKRLQIKGYEIDGFIDGQDAYEAISDGYNCFVLDINVPNIDGIQILKRIREYYKEVPVIIISATVELDIIKEAYDFGCNDYLKKPFFIDELEIKIEKLCKTSAKRIEFGVNCSFDYKDSSITIDGNNTRLTKKERLLLNLLLINKNQIVTYEAIENYIWAGSFVSLESIRSLIRRVRKILDSDYIQTVVDTGYIFKT
ncbi:MAG: two-component system OmpR family response regulator [Sulfurimonas sp.]|jgi:two-component system OmpR family response regulator